MLVAAACCPHPPLLVPQVAQGTAAGLDALRAIGPQLPRLLEAGGLAAVEIGFDQAAPAAALLTQGGLSARLARDLAGRPRALLLTRAS